jgi:hypothetical protein
MRTEGFSCSLGISKLQFLIKKRYKLISVVIFLQFLVIKTLDPDWIRIRIDLKCWIRIQVRIQ